MNIKSFNSIRDINESAWNELAEKNRLICRHEYLKAIESSRINDCRFFYPVVYDGDKIMAHTCLYFISTELDSFAQGLLKKAICGVRVIWKNFLILKSVECGTPVALGNTISFRKGVDKVAALKLIVQETEQIAKKLGVKVLLFRDFYTEELDFYNNLRDMGYRQIYNLPCARMKIQWKNFEEYIQSMRSHYRYKMQKRLQEFEKNGGTIEFIQQFSTHARELSLLWQNAYNNATEYRREILPPVFFENMDKHLKDNSSILLARINGNPAGFALLIHDTETLNWLFCGLDYKYNKDYCVYFNLMYRIIELAINMKFEDVDLGITTLLPKMDIGGEVVRLFMYMKHTNPILNMIVPKVFALMTPSKIPEQRNIWSPKPHIVNPNMETCPALSGC